VLYPKDIIMHIEPEMIAPVREATSVGAALEALTTALHKYLPIHRASIRRIDYGRESAVMVAVWSLWPTSLRPGLVIPLTVTSLPEIIGSKGAVLGSQEEPSVLLDQILAAEGIRSWITVPLRGASRVYGLLSFSSRFGDGLRQEHVPFFDQLGAAVEESLVGLIARWGPPGHERRARATDATSWASKAKD